MTYYPQYGQQPYEYPSMPPYVAPQALPTQPAYPYASWWSRVGAYLTHVALALVPGTIVATVGLVIATRADQGSKGTVRPLRGSRPNWLGVVTAVLGLLFVLAVAVWNQVIRQGKTGQSLGKHSVGIAVIQEATGRPLGPGAALGRWAAQMAINVVGNNLLMGIPGLLNSLWPLWGAKHQTWHDKVVQSVVVGRSRTWPTQRPMRGDRHRAPTVP